MSSGNAVDRAVELFDDGYLCSQSLLISFTRDIDIPEATAARIAAPFGAGIGRTGGVCGAVSGALMAIGLRFGHETPADSDAKERTFTIARELLRRFEDRHGTVQCRTLLGVDIGDPAKLERARAEGIFEEVCPIFVRDAAEILAELLDDSPGQLRSPAPTG